MRSLFSQPKPRHFTHRYQYIDERKERMRALRAETGANNSPSPTSDDAKRQQRVRGSFATAAHERELRRRGAVSAAWTWGALAAFVAALALLLLYLW